ncbi:MAG: hypothetical protein QOD39_2374, partial [Mycobacterium sp.]|nr:hypothetical protein [Mycobacterium sp.]
RNTNAAVTITASATVTTTNRVVNPPRTPAYLGLQDCQTEYDG